MCYKLTCSFRFVFFFTILLVVASKRDVFGMLYPDFETSMLRETLDFSEKVMNRKKLYRECNSKYVNLFRQIYEKNSSEANESLQKKSYRIPRIIHHICLAVPVSLKFRESIESWTRLNGWEYKLWTDENVKDLQMYNQDLYNNTTNYEEKSNILRLEILSRFGGIYVDMKYECFNPEIFEELHRNFDFYIGFEPIEYGKINRFNIFKVSNAIIGSVPYHPLIQDLIINIKASCLAYRSYSPAERTGPAYCTRVICQYVEAENKIEGSLVFRNIYLPTTFFYFLTDIDDIENSRFCIEPTFLPEIASLHYFKGSLMKKKDKQIAIKTERGL